MDLNSALWTVAQNNVGYGVFTAFTVAFLGIIFYAIAASFVMNHSKNRWWNLLHAPALVVIALVARSAGYAEMNHEQADYVQAGEYVLKTDFTVTESDDYNDPGVKWYTLHAGTPLSMGNVLGKASYPEAPATDQTDSQDRPKMDISSTDLPALRAALVASNNPVFQKQATRIAAQ
jgi:hypothetical protein